MESISIPYLELVEVVLSSDREGDKCFENISRNYHEMSEQLLKELKIKLSRNFIPNFSRRWQAASRNKDRFLKQNEEWLRGSFSVNVDSSLTPMDVDEPGPSSRPVGRKEKPFDECCQRTKRYKVKKLLENCSKELIVAAANEAKGTSKSASFTPEQALSLLLDASLSKHQYQIIRKATIEIGFDIFPSYHKVLEAKKECYPSEVEITESCATVKLQTLLNHTATRIMQGKSEEDVCAMGSELTLISKWGCDGSSGHSEYKQTFEEENASDASMFLTSLVPLCLHEKGERSLVYWKNPTPSSTRYCRPIRFEFIKETPESTTREISRMNTEIESLTDTVTHIKEKSYKIHHELLFTMIDGKISHTVSNTSSMVCNICQAKPSEMNKLMLLKSKSKNIQVLNWGMSPLHARIKFMECLLHIAYNKSFQQWRTNADTKKQREETKKRIQDEFWRRIGLKIDVVKQGMGTTNDGNTSRRFFSDPSLTADITGVNENLIRRFTVILQAINSGVHIDPDKFGKYCQETANMYVGLYGWYYMPVTVHKILIHGEEIIAAAVLPIGMLTEEAQEARNKDYRAYRQNHSRKCSRVQTNTDVMNFLLASSDPYLSGLRAEPITNKETNKKLNHELWDEVKSLFYGNI